MFAKLALLRKSPGYLLHSDTDSAHAAADARWKAPTERLQYRFSDLLKGTVVVFVDKEERVCSLSTAGQWVCVMFHAMSYSTDLLHVIIRPLFHWNTQQIWNNVFIIHGSDLKINESDLKEYFNILGVTCVCFRHLEMEATHFFWQIRSYRSHNNLA